MKKKLILGIIILLLIILFLKMFSKSHSIEYVLTENKNNFKIQEEYDQKSKTDLAAYYIAIQTKYGKFYYNIFKGFKRKRKIIQKLEYYKDKEYECILPIFSDNKILTDVLCRKGDNYYNYVDIEGENQELDQFVKNIEEYSVAIFQDKLVQKDRQEKLVIYRNINQLLDRIIIENYKGIDIVSKNSVQINKLFKKDVYKKEIQDLNGKYYITADYNQKYEFHEIFKVDITTNKVKKITFDQSISLDSYMQGNVSGRSYLLDRSNKLQYEIDPERNTVFVFGSKDKEVQIYNQNKWENITINQAIENNIYFNYYRKKNKDNETIDQPDGEKIGYIYLYKKIGSVYYVYRSLIGHKTKKQLIFQTDDINRIVYKNDRVYYVQDNYLKMYSDSTGNKSLIKNDEFRFNKNLKFYIY